MKELFDQYSRKASRNVTKAYSTSFYAGVRCLDSRIRNDIHAIYGFVRFADEIVDSFHEYPKADLLEKFRTDTFEAIQQGISLNPILNSFQNTVNKYQIDHELIKTFLRSMEMDLQDVEYDQSNYETYILGSAEVVGLMCLKVFVYGNEAEYERLKPFAMKLGAAFQKVNFLRDLKDDINGLGRQYFPNLPESGLNSRVKLEIEKEIEEDFKAAFRGIVQLPKSSRLGVYVSYVYYTKLLKRIKARTIQELMAERIRVPNNKKVLLFAKSYIKNSINLL